MNTARFRSLALILIVLLLASSMLACDLGGGPTKPTITITAPTSDTQFEVGEEINILSSANDAKGITRVELLVDGELYRTDSTPSLEGEKSIAMAQTWTAADPGMHTLSVIAYNVDGEASEPWAVTIEVVGAGGAVTPPTPTTPPPPPGATATTPPPPEATATTPPPQETAEAGQPDLYISEIKVEPQEPQQGAPAMVGVRVHNGGTVDSGQFRAIWSSGEADAVLEWTETSLAPGASRWLQDEYTYNEAGEFSSSAEVDVDGVVDEANEDNNVLTVDVQVQGAEAEGPDLYISQIISEPPSPVMDEPAMVGVRIHNQGTAAATHFRVVWMSGEGDDGIEWQVDSLAPGASNWVQEEYVYTGPGHYTTHAVVDFDGDVDETDDENNEFSWELDVVP